MSCPHPLVTHRYRDTTPPHPLRRIHECIDSGCTAGVVGHSTSMPCRWSWPLAHGKAYNGEPFPRRRCPACAHIRRAGKPRVDLVSA